MRDILIDLSNYSVADVYTDNIIREGENNASQLVITLSEDLIGDFSYRLNFQLNDLQPYNSQALTPVLNVITFPLSNVFTFMNGVLKTELQVYDVSDTLIKSTIFLLRILPAIDGTPITIPPEYETYIAMGAPSVPDVSDTLVKRGISGEFGISTIDFTLTPTTLPTETGRLQWNDTYKTLDLVSGNGVVQQLGQESLIYARNDSLSDMPDGCAVAITGSTGDLPSITIADANETITKTYVIGITTQAIPKNSSGFVVTRGMLNGINTLAFNEGDQLWLSETAGQLRSTPPSSPATWVFMGWCVKKSASGILYISIIRQQSAVDVTLLDSENYFVIKNVEGALAETGLKIKGTYDDLPPMSLITAKVSANQPTLAPFVGNIQQYTFDAINDEVFGTTEVTHQYKEGTLLLPHIHWATNGLEATPKYVKWELEYVIIKPNGSASAPVISTSAELEIPASTPDRTHFISSLGSIDGTEIVIGTYIAWRLRRIASVGTAPSANPFGLAIGVHVEMDTFGSTTIMTK